MKKITKLFLAFFLFLCVTSFVAITSLSSLNPVMVKAEGESVVADDFTTTQISSSNVYKSNGVGSDANVHGIVPGGWGDPVTISSDAYVIYKLEAASGKFSSLKLDLNAKIWNQDNGDAHWVNSIVIYTGANEGELTEAYKIGACAGNYGMAFDFADLPTVDLTEKAAGLDTIYVKVQLVLSTAIGASQELAFVGVKLAKVKFTYTAESEPKITVADDFTTTQIGASHVFKSNGVGSDANDHGVVPGGWSGNVTVSDNSYLLYKLESTGEFTSLTLDLNGKLWNQNSNDGHWENSIVVYAGETEEGMEQVTSINANNHNMSGDFTDFPTIDLTEKASGLSAVYVKIKLNQTLKTGETQDLFMLGVKLAKVVFNYTEEESTGPRIEYTHVTDNFGATPVSESKAIEVKGIGGDGNATHGAVPGVWGDPVTIAEESYLVYKVTAEKGFFDTLTLDINAKIWNQNNGEAHEYNAVVVYAGLTKANMTKVAEYKHQNDSGSFADLTTVNLTELANGEHTVYVKIELKQSVAIGEAQELAWVGVKLMKVDFCYSQSEAEFVTVTYVGITEGIGVDAEQIKGATLNGIQVPEVPGYTFKGWYLDEAFENAIPEGYKPEADVILYAKYEEIAYAITYELDGGNNASANPTTYTQSATVVLEDPAKEGYTFKGWYTTATFEEGTSIYEFLGTRMEDITLYAKWEKNQTQGGDITTTVITTTVAPTTTTGGNTTTVPSSTTTAGENTTDAPAKKGCKNSVVASFSILAFLGATLLVAKKKREE